MEKDWVKVFSTKQAFQAEMIRIMLEESNIECVLINKQDSSYIFIGEVEVYTRQNDVLQALNLIRKHQEE